MNGNIAGLLVGLVIAAALGGVMVSAIDMDSAEMQRELAEAQAYCELTHGSPVVYNAQVMGNHGGYHCEANDGGHPHLHDVPEWAEEMAYRVVHEDVETDWESVAQRVEAEHAAKPWYEKGNGPFVVMFAEVFGVVAFFGVVLAAIPYLPGRAGGSS